MKKVEKNIASVSTGIIVAFAIVFSQLFCFQTESSSKDEAKTEQQQKENPEDHVYISVPSTTLPSAHVELNPNVFFLFEVLSEREVSEVAEPRFSLPTGQFFRKIFGVIISPNAP